MSISRNSLMELAYVGILGATMSVACMSNCSMQNARENAKPETIEARADAQLRIDEFRADAQLRIEESRRATIEKIEDFMGNPQYLAVLEERRQIGMDYVNSHLGNASPQQVQLYVTSIAGRAPTIR